MAGAVKAFSIVLRKSPEAAGVPGRVGSRWRVSGSATLLPSPSWSHGGCRGADITPPHTSSRGRRRNGPVQGLLFLFYWKRDFFPPRNPQQMNARMRACCVPVPRCWRGRRLRHRPEPRERPACGDRAWWGSDPVPRAAALGPRRLWCEDARGPRAGASPRFPKEARNRNLSAIFKLL